MATFGDVLNPLMNAQTQEDADLLFERLVSKRQEDFNESREKAEENARNSIGYYAGYFSHETQKRMEKFYNAPYPGYPSPELKEMVKQNYQGTYHSKEGVELSPLEELEFTLSMLSDFRCSLENTVTNREALRSLGFEERSDSVAPTQEQRYITIRPFQKWYWIDHEVHNPLLKIEKEVKVDYRFVVSNPFTEEKE